MGEGVQIVGSRLETKVEDADKKTIVAVASAFRNHDAFSLSLVNVPVAISVATRVEGDAQSQEHNEVVEKIVDVLVNWHKDGEAMEEALSNEKFLAGELRMDGGTTQTYDREHMCWTDAININIRGAEKFISPPRLTTLVDYTNGSTVELDIQGELTQNSIPNYYSIASVNIGEAVTSIGGHAFDSCRSLAEVTMPNTITSIGDAAFTVCQSLVSITIPSPVASLGASVFQDCYMLQTVVVPASVTSIGSNAFRNCQSLVSVTMEGKTKNQVQRMSNYSNWGLRSGCVIHCSDGDITI